MTHTQGKKKGNISRLWTGPDLGFGRQRLQSPFYKYVQRIKGKYNNESKNLNNEVETMKTLKINPKVENILKTKEIRQPKDESKIHQFKESMNSKIA